MDSPLRSQLLFHLTGRRAPDDGQEPPSARLRPALLAAYRDLDALRYDFPVVLAEAGGESVQSLSRAVDVALRATAAPGVEGEGRRRRALGIERAIRGLVASGARGTLAQLWDRATDSLAAGAEDLLRRDALEVCAALPVDGQLAGCDAALPTRFLRHAWSAVQEEKARDARERIERLVVRLGDILRADFARSAAALRPPALKATFGPAHHAMFDFQAMSGLLSRGDPHGGLGERRRARIQQVLSVLRSQRFFAPPGRRAGADARDFHSFDFDGTDAALQAFRQRLPELARLLKALQVAELEIGGNYRDELHDPLFATFDERSVAAQDLEFFPDYLVCLASGGSTAREQLTQALSSGVPLKVLVQVSELFEDDTLGAGQRPFGLRAAQIASTVMSLDDVFVLQTAASNLFQLRGRVERGLRYAGPAFFCVYAAPDGGAIPGYLQAAAAMQSRAFPAFSYDPGAGADLAERFSLENNPQPEADWPVERLAYADADLQAVAEDVAFTFVDFAVCDPRQARHFALAPRADWGDGMVPAQSWLAGPSQGPSTGVPYVLAVDDGDLLCRLVADEPLMRAARRCRDSWHRLQELGGIRDSRAQQLLERERKAWEEEHRRKMAAAPAATADEPVAAGAPGPATTASAAAPAEPEPARNPDEAYIETLRCSSCNECTQVNPRMFAYDGNKQAYIADLKAGTYRQLVEAAESCQLSIIHPGKPWNPGEPGLDELIERARPFA